MGDLALPFGLEIKKRVGLIGIVILSAGGGGVGPVGLTWRRELEGACMSGCVTPWQRGWGGAGRGLTLRWPGPVRKVS